MILLLFTVATTLFNMIVGAGIRDNGTAILMSEIVSLFMMVLSGLLINQSKSREEGGGGWGVSPCSQLPFPFLFSDAIPAVLSWIPYLSFAHYGYEALAVNDAADIIIVDPQLANIQVC